MKSMRKILNIFVLTGIVLIGILLLSPVAMSEENQDKTPITLRVEYGERTTTGREFDILAKPKISTQAGSTAKVKIGDEKSGFEIEMTPTIGNRETELVIVKVIARTMVEKSDGKGNRIWEMQEILNETKRIKRGAAAVSEVKVEGTDKVVRITIIPWYEK